MAINCFIGGDSIYWDNKDFNSYNYFLKQKFGEKVFKVPVSLATTCPNRDGSKGLGGCIFCSENGSGDFLKPHNINITDQFNQMIQEDTKWNANKYIIYFQSFTNTYLKPSTLKKALDEALAINGVVGIAIATRVDCISDEILDLLIDYNSKTFLSIELGLQTSKDSTHNLINSCFTTSDYINIMDKLTSNNIFTVTHVILGLPFETKQDILNTINVCISAKTNGIKLQLLYILKNTKLEKLCNETPFHILDFDEYINLIVDILEILPEDIVIMRLTGDGKKEDLVAPLYSLNKRKILNTIDMELRNRNSYQAKKSSKKL